MTIPNRRALGACAVLGLVVASLAGCNGATPPEAPGQGNALPAMQSGPTSVGPAGLGPAGPGSAEGSGNLANPGGGALGPAPVLQ